MLGSAVRINIEYSNHTRFDDIFPDLILSADPINRLSDISDLIPYIRMIIRIRIIRIFGLFLSLLEVSYGLE